MKRNTGLSIDADERRICGKDYILAWVVIHMDVKKIRMCMVQYSTSIASAANGVLRYGGTAR